MKPIAIRYVKDVEAARSFYQVLGLQVSFASRTNRRGAVAWTEFAQSPGALALHEATAESTPPVELAMEAEEPLEAVVERLTAAGYQPTDIVDESFGRSFRVPDPEGLVIQVNDQERDLQA